MSFVLEGNIGKIKRKGEMNMSNIMILTSYSGRLWFSIKKRPNNTVSATKLAKYLLKGGHGVSIMCYEDVDLDKDYHGFYILYHSSEEINLMYKSYMEDIILGLMHRGAILMPEYKFMVAHHNKVYMEILRKEFTDKRLKTISSHLFSIPESVVGRITDYPAVIKSSDLSSSSGVSIACNERELLKQAKRVSKIPLFINSHQLRELGCLFLSKIHPRYKDLRYPEYGLYLKKFVVQNFIENMNGDYKVLVYGEKYYVLKRNSRKNDFRASGSGDFFYPKFDDEVKQILDFAKLVRDELKMPMCSLDVGFDGTACHLIEFQCVSFGTYTLENSVGYYYQSDNQWIWVSEKSDLEKCMADSIIWYIAKRENAL